MADLSTRQELSRETDADPKIDLVKEAYENTLTDLASHFNQTSVNHDDRNCLWENQDLQDGRKHGSPTNPVHPWEDASDLRPFVIDTIINENVALLVESLIKGNLTAIPAEGNDIERGRMIGLFMKWLVFSGSQIKDIRRQANILANYQEEKSIGALQVVWDTRMEPTLEEITLQKFLDFIQPREEEAEQPDPQVVQQIETLLSIIEDKEMAKEVAEILRILFPSIKQRKAKSMAKELRETGVTSIATPSIVWNRPVLKALSIDEDFFFSPNIMDIQDAAYVFHAEYLTPEQLRARVTTQDWDKDWVDEVIKTTIGTSSDISQDGINATTDRFRQNQSIDVASGFVRVVNAYSKETTEHGLPGVFITSFHPDVDEFGSSGLLGYRPSRYPFVVFPREYRTKRLLDSRGVPEVGKGHQEEIKVQMDSRVDRTTLATCPPRYHALGRKPSNWGPGDSLGVRRRDETGFMDIPPFDQGSIEIEGTVRDNMARMFGRPVDEQNAQHSAMMQQDMVNQWLERWKEAISMVWDLHQQFGPDEQFFRVVGSGNAEAMQFIRGQGSERFDFYLDFAVANQDASQLLEKLKTAGEIMSQFDRKGTGDYDEYMRVFMGAIDPSYADRFIKPAQVATEEEVRQTQDDIAKISSGQAVNAPENANTELRMQIVEQYFQGTEDIPATDVQERLQSDPEFQARIQKYVEQLKFQDTQRQNALIGKLGTTPGNAVPST